MDFVTNWFGFKMPVIFTFLWPIVFLVALFEYELKNVIEESNTDRKIISLESKWKKKICIFDLSRTRTCNHVNYQHFQYLLLLISYVGYRIILQRKCICYFSPFMHLCSKLCKLNLVKLMLTVTWMLVEYSQREQTRALPIWAIRSHTCFLFHTSAIGSYLWADFSCFFHSWVYKFD